VRDERGRYRFVDPDLQARSVGQKALLRLEVAQARAVKQQLRELRTALTGG
jgi:arginyl-tRNA--protein-N-Asp/Glu arginylyltransferase